MRWLPSIIHKFLKLIKTGSLTQDFRPSSLTNCHCKVFERMIHFCLMWYFQSKSLLSPSQFGFRRARSTAEPIARLETYILTAFARRESVIAIFFDLKKAYGTIWRYHILHHLGCQLGIRENMGFFFTAFFQDQSFCVKVSSPISSSFPLLFQVLPPGVRFSLYIDDLASYAAGFSLPLLHHLLKSAISSVSQWATNHGFRFSTAKSFSIFFTRSWKAPPFYHPTCTMLPSSTALQVNSLASHLTSALHGETISYL